MKIVARIILVFLAILNVAKSIQFNNDWNHIGRGYMGSDIVVMKFIFVFITAMIFILFTLSTFLLSTYKKTTIALLVLAFLVASYGLKASDGNMSNLFDDLYSFLQMDMIICVFVIILILSSYLIQKVRLRKTITDSSFLTKDQHDSRRLGNVVPIVVTSPEDTKECPQCAETIKAKAKVCRYCRYSFEQFL